MTELRLIRRSLVCRATLGLVATAAAAALLAGCGTDEEPAPVSPPATDTPPERPTLVGFASLPAATFAPGPTSGRQVGAEPVNLQPLPFLDKQPVQGFSGLVDKGDGTFLAMPDNGYGSMENSADFVLRVYTIRPALRTAEGGSGEIAVEGYIELSDPYHHLPFTITNQFTPDRVLTGADLDIESMQRAPDGTLWFGDEFGPYLLHTDVTGRLLAPPIPLPDADAGGAAELRSPQNPMLEEASAVRVMNAAREHARAHGNARTPVFSPYFVMLNDGDPATGVESRKAPPEGSGMTPASSELFDVTSLHAAGYPVVSWTVNEAPQMEALLALGVDGIISDRPDLLYQAVAAFDRDGDGTPGDLLDAEGLIDPKKFDAQGHRGGRNLRPENTLPAMEVALDHLMTTLELDNGITYDGVPVLSHDPHVMAQKCRRADGSTYEQADEVLIKDLTLVELQSQFICDKVFRGPEQLNDHELSPVSLDFAQGEGLGNPYAIPTLDQVFRFIDLYINYYQNGPGSGEPEATRRWRNAMRVRFNIETKVNPRAEFAERTIGPVEFAEIVAGTIVEHDLATRADVQSFDFRTLLQVQERFPEIRTAYLFGDFPIFDDPSVEGSADGTNLQDEGGASSPWLAGMPWPYRKTLELTPVRVKKSGGFEGLAMSPDGKKLFPLLEQPLEGADRTLLLHEFDVAAGAYTGVRWEYALEEKGVSVGDFILIEEGRGLALERDGTAGDLAGFKALYEVRLPAGGGRVEKELLVDLLHIDDPSKLGPAGLEGDVGLGEELAMPFVTIESVVFLGGRRVAVMNDNNYPFSVGRHVGAGLPDDSEMVVIDTGVALDPVTGE